MFKGFQESSRDLNQFVPELIYSQIKNESNL